MKHLKQSLILMLALALLVTLVSCTGAGQSNGMDENFGGNNLYPENRFDDLPLEENDAENGTFQENPFVATSENNISTLSADVDTASYTYFRKLINNGYDLEDLIRNGTNFRTEEFVNYFRYNGKAPDEGELFGTSAEIADCPWNENSVLMKMTLQAENKINRAGNNLVFLIDVSGSMASSDKLALLQTTFSYLTAQLDADDIVSIVTYSGSEKVILEGCRGNYTEQILNAINSLRAYGSTHGEAGLTKAYEIAERYRLEGGNNRIIMASDGDLNVGISSAEELTAYVEEKRNTGIYLSILGFGTGNYRDGNMEALADNGNGVYYYIDGESEAEKVFGSDLLSTLYTVANDVKIQITFNKSAVASYRLIGYENRLLNEEDFRDDTKDAGDVGAGHQVTVCYELVLTEHAKTTDEAWLTLAVSYKHPGDTVSQENQYPIGKEVYTDKPSADFAFVVSLIETTMILHQSKYLDGLTLTDVLEDLRAQNPSDPYRAEFCTLIKKVCQ